MAAEQWVDGHERSTAVLLEVDARRGCRAEANPSSLAAVTQQARQRAAGVGVEWVRGWQGRAGHGNSCSSLTCAPARCPWRRLRFEPPRGYIHICTVCAVCCARRAIAVVYAMPAHAPFAVVQRTAPIAARRYPDLLPQTSKPCKRVGPLDGPRQRGHMRSPERGCGLGGS